MPNKTISVLLSASIFLLLPACKKSTSSGDPDQGRPGNHGTSKVMVDTYIDTSIANPLDKPSYLCVGQDGELFVSENNQNSIYKVDPLLHFATLLVGQSLLTLPFNLWYHDDVIYCGDGAPKTVSLGGSAQVIPYDNPNGYLLDAVGVVMDIDDNYIIAAPDALFEIPSKEPHDLTLIGIQGLSKPKDGPYAAAEYGYIGSITEGDDNIIYFSDGHKIRKLDQGSIVTVAGSDEIGNADGQGTEASFGGSLAITPGPSNSLFIADYVNHTVRQMSAGGKVTTIAGDGKGGYLDGPADGAEFNSPSGIAWNALTNEVYVSDYDNGVIRRITFPQ